MVSVIFRKPRKLIAIALCILVALGVGIYLSNQAWQHPQTTVTINVANHTTSLPDGFFLYQHLTAEGITIKSITSADRSLIISFNTLEESQAAEKVLKKILDNNYQVD